MTLEDRLRTTLRETAETISVDEVHLPPIEAVPPARRRNPLLGFAAGVAAVAVLGLAVWLAPGSAPPQPPRLDTAESMDLEWTRLDLLPDDFAAGPFVVGPEGALTRAYRFRGPVGDNTQLVFSSADGVDWSRVDAQGFGGGGLVAYAGGYVSYGRYEGNRTTATTTALPTEFPPPAVWTSPDGIEWEMTLLPLPSPQEAVSELVSYQMLDLAATDSEMVAIATEFDEDRPEMEGDGTQAVSTRQLMWSTDDAGNWELIDFPMEHPRSAAVGPEGIIVTDVTEEGTTIWRKEGDSWAAVASLPEGEFASAVVGNATGYLLTGESAWFSSDGSEWREVGPENAVSVEAGVSSFVALGISETETSVWWSNNGLDWELAGSGDDFGIEEDGFISYMGVTDHAVIIAGQTGRGIEELRSGETKGYIAVGTLDQ